MNPTSPGILIQQVRFAERSVLSARSIACHDGPKAATEDEIKEISKLCNDTRGHLNAIQGALRGAVCPPERDAEVEKIAIAFARLLEFLYEAGGKTRYRLSNLLEAVEHLQLRDLLLEDDAVARNLAAFGKLCYGYENVVMRNGLCLKIWRLKDHVEFCVENTRVTEAAEQKEGALVA